LIFQKHAKLEKNYDLGTRRERERERKNLRKPGAT
jgi:hypothetical protein